MSAAAFSPVPASVIAALAGQLLFVTALPIVLLVWWRRHSRASLTPAVIGMLAFLVFAQLLEQVLHYAFLISDNAVSRAIAANPGLYVLYAGLAAGLFEETGRFMAFKYLLRRSGGRETAALVEGAWRRGARFDAWDEHFDEEAWAAAATDIGIDVAGLAQTTFPLDYVLPWEHVSTGVSTRFLRHERELASQGITTPDCSFERCSACGVCPGMKVENELAAPRVLGGLR